MANSAFAAPTLTSLYPAGGARGASIEVSATGSFDAWPVRVWTSDPAVTGVAGKEKGKLTLTVGKDAAPGVCWLRLADDSGASALRPFLIGTAPDSAEVEPNDEPAKAQAATLPAAVNGKLVKSGDVDCFAVTLTKGQTLIASLDAHRTLRSPMDAVLQVVSSSGSVLEQNNDFRGLDPQLAFAAPANGTYIVRVFAFPSQPDSSIRHFGSEACVYRLTLTAGGFLDFATPLAAQQGTETTLTLHGWNLPERTRKLPADTDRLAPPWSANGVRILREPHPCHDLTIAPSSNSLAPPFTATARVTDATAVPFTGTKGKPLAVELEAASLGSPLTPVLRVLDDGGKELAKAEPPKLHTDCTLRFTPPADGRYRAEVRDLHGRGGARFVFRLRVKPVAPEIEPTVATDRLVVTPGKPFDLVVTLGAKNGSFEELDWIAEGLPEGVTVKPAGKAAGANPTLRFEASKAGVSGAVRLSAVAKSDSRRRPVVAKLADFDATTADLWLTVPPAAK